MKIVPNRVRTLFPLKHYLWQLVSRPTSEAVYNPFRFWRSYRIDRLERCWNWEKDWQERLERCWQKEWKPEPQGQNLSKCKRPLNCHLNHPSSIELKWRGVAYRRRAVNLAGIAKPVTNSANYSKELPKDSDRQPSQQI